METQITGHHSGHKHEALIDLLLDCALTCESCVASCLNEIDVTPMALCIELARDNADICNLTAKLLSRNSKFADELLFICEKLSFQSAIEFNKHDYSYCKRCEEICEICTQAIHLHLKTNDSIK